MAEQTQAVAKRGEQVGSKIKEAMSKIPDLLRRKVTPVKVVQSFYAALTKTPKLQECTVPSLCMAMIQAELLDVDCTGFTGEAAMVPLKNGKTGNIEANLWIMYQGMMKCARKSKQMSHIEARVVYSTDELFDWKLGLTPVLDHIPGEESNPDKITHVYAIARLSNGMSLFEVMRKPEVDKIRNGSRAKNDNAWSNNYSEMARKTVVRRLCKYLPKTPELERAMQLDNAIETGDRPPIEVNGEIITIQEQEDVFAPGTHKPEKMVEVVVNDPSLIVPKPMPKPQNGAQKPSEPERGTPTPETPSNEPEPPTEPAEQGEENGRKSTPRGRKRELMESLSLPLETHKEYTVKSLEALAKAREIGTEPNPPAEPTGEVDPLFSGKPEEALGSADQMRQDILNHPNIKLNPTANLEALMLTIESLKHYEIPAIAKHIVEGKLQVDGMILDAIAGALDK